MADLTITPSSVVLYSGEPLPDQRAGAAFGTGDVVAQADDGTWSKAQCNGTAVQAGQNNLGIALGAAQRAGGRVSIAGAGSAGTVYCVSANAGKITPAADMASTNRVTVLGLGIGSNNILVQPVYNAGSVLA